MISGALTIQSWTSSASHELLRLGSNKNVMTQVTVIPLEFWQDPQGDVILTFSEHECSVYFGCWSATSE